MKILFVYQAPSTFVMKDLDILSQSHDVRALRFRGARDLGALWTGTRWCDLTFSWFGSLPTYLKAFDTCIFPYRLDAFNISCSPLKLYEYLAVGKPVVSTNLPEVGCLANVVTIAPTAAHFGAAMERSLGPEGSQPILQRLRVAEQTSWDARARGLLSVINLPASI